MSAQHDVPEVEGAMCGVPGRWQWRRFNGPAIISQAFGSEARPLPSEPALRVCFSARYDDSCRNGSPSFAITGTVYDPRRGGPLSDRAHVAGGCVHGEIAAAFPEVAHLIPWHLTGAIGPMHYLENAVYMAGDRDHRGLRAGERRQILGRNGPCWILRIIAEDGTESDLPGVWSNGAQGAEPPPLPGRLAWVPNCFIGEGKARDLAAARAAAVWPDATDAELMAEPNVLRAALMARLPALLERFRADMAGAGFMLEGPTAPGGEA